MNTTRNSQLINVSMLSNDGLWLTVHTHHKSNGKLINSKMDTFTSLPLDFNSTCLSRSAKNNTPKTCVCRRCYARQQSAIHPQIFPKMRLNSSTLDNPHFIPQKIKTINNCLRYISFGDISNLIQAINIIRHASINPTLHKAIWSKQYRTFSKAIELSSNQELSTTSQIKHLNFIWSASKINSHTFIIPKNFTKSFYVYTDETNLTDAKIEAQKQGFKVIECKKQCAQCFHCYKNSENTIIMELLK